MLWLLARFHQPTHQVGEDVGAQTAMHYIYPVRPWFGAASSFEVIRSVAFAEVISTGSTVGRITMFCFSVERYLRQYS